MDICKALLWLTLLMLVAARKADGLDCYQCVDIPDPNNCHTIQACTAGMCYITRQEYTNGSVSYSLGCTNTHIQECPDYDPMAPETTMTTLHTVRQAFNLTGQPVSETITPDPFSHTITKKMIPTASSTSTTSMTTEVTFASSSPSMTTEETIASSSPSMTTEETFTSSSPSMTTEETLNTSSPSMTTEETFNTSSPSMTTEETFISSSPSMTTEETFTLSSPSLTTEGTFTSSSPSMTTEELFKSSSPSMTTEETFTSPSPSMTTEGTFTFSSTSLTTEEAFTSSSPSITTKETFTPSPPSLTTEETFASSSLSMTTEETFNTSSPSMTTEETFTSSSPSMTTEETLTSSSPIRTTEETFTSTSPSMTTEEFFTTSSPSMTTEETFITPSSSITTEETFTSSSAYMTTEEYFTTSSPPMTTKETFTTSSPSMTTEEIFTTSPPSMTTEETLTTSSSSMTTKETLYTSSPSMTTEETFTSSSPSMTTEKTFTSSSPSMTTEETFNSSSPSMTTEEIFTTSPPSMTTEETLTTSSSSMTTEETFNTSSPSMTTEETFTSSSPSMTTEKTFTSSSPSMTTEETFNSSSPSMTTEEFFTTSSPSMTTEDTFTSSSPSMTNEETFTSSSSPMTTKETFITSYPSMTTEETFTSSSPPMTTVETLTTSSPSMITEETFTSSSPPMTTEEIFNSSSPSMTTEEIFTSSSPSMTTEETYTTSSPSTTTEEIFTSSSPSMTTAETYTTSPPSMTTEEILTTSSSPSMTTEETFTSSSLFMLDSSSHSSTFTSKKPPHSHIQTGVTQIPRQQSSTTELASYSMTQGNSKALSLVTNAHAMNVFTSVTPLPTSDNKAIRYPSSTFGGQTIMPVPTTPIGIHTPIHIPSLPPSLFNNGITQDTLSMTHYPLVTDTGEIKTRTAPIFAPPMPTLGKTVRHIWSLMSDGTTPNSNTMVPPLETNIKKNRRLELDRGTIGRNIQGTTRCCNETACNKHLFDICKDTNEDCSYLKEHFGICSIPFEAQKICKKTCDICNYADGQWSTWETWSSCSVTCENGTQSRSRSCTNPKPADGGRNCSGNSVETRDCMMRKCPADGNWSEWGAWDNCSATCGQGLRRRDRMCSNPVPDPKGRFCQGDSRDDEICFSTSQCPDAEWTSWSGWSQCLGSCSLGIKHRQRNCSTAVVVADHVVACLGPSTESALCLQEHCQGDWLDWTHWSTCSSTCGYGVRVRDRICPTLSYAGTPCVGDRKDTKICHEVTCSDLDSAFFVTGQPAEGIKRGTIVLQRVETNVGGDYDVTSGVFVCRIPGIYKFFVHIQKRLDVGEAFCHLYANEKQILSVSAISSFLSIGDDKESSNLAVLHLNVGDIVRLDGCTNPNTFTELTSFSGVLMTPD